MTQVLNTAGYTGAKKTYEPLPVGEYAVSLDRLDGPKTTKAGNGEYINANFKVVDGDHAGRLIFERFMLNHTNENVKRIGNERLNKFIQAAGKSGGFAELDYDINNLEGLIGKNIVARVKIEAGTNGYKDKNAISSFVKR